jgi:F0F1-type ATP synthase membrane subunit b/b'/GTP-binding protein EngB required for normal cell division
MEAEVVAFLEANRGGTYVQMFKDVGVENLEQLQELSIDRQPLQPFIAALPSFKQKPLLAFLDGIPKNVTAHLKKAKAIQSVETLKFDSQTQELKNQIAQATGMMEEAKKLSLAGADESKAATEALVTKMKQHEFSFEAAPSPKILLAALRERIESCQAGQNIMAECKALADREVLENANPGPFTGILLSADSEMITFKQARVIQIRSDVHIALGGSAEFSEIESEIASSEQTDTWYNNEKTMGRSITAGASFCGLFSGVPFAAKGSVARSQKNESEKQFKVIQMSQSSSMVKLAIHPYATYELSVEKIEMRPGPACELGLNENASVISDERIEQFFETYGTHVIRGGSLGGWWGVEARMSGQSSSTDAHSRRVLASAVRAAISAGCVVAGISVGVENERGKQTQLNHHTQQLLESVSISRRSTGSAELDLPTWKKMMKIDRSRWGVIDRQNPWQTPPLALWDIVAPINKELAVKMARVFEDRIKIKNRAPSTNAAQPPLSKLNFAPSAPSGSRQLNILVVGTAGVGKSSLVNLVTGKEENKVDNGATGCTFEYKMTECAIDSIAITMVDTTGLSEAASGTVSSQAALGQLYNLLYRTSYGFNLIIMVVKAGRILTIDPINYDIFVNRMCKGKIPVVCVATGCDFADSLDEWAKVNKAQFDQAKMPFAGMTGACCLDKAVPGGEQHLLRRRVESRDAIAGLILSHSLPQPAKVISVFEISSVAKGILAVLLTGPVGLALVGPVLVASLVGLAGAGVGLAGAGLARLLIPSSLVDQVASDLGVTKDEARAILAGRDP